MSVNSVSTRFPPSYSLTSGNRSQTAGSAALAKELAGKSFPGADASQVTSAEVDGATQDAAPTGGDFAGVGSQSTFQQVLRDGAATAGRSTSGASGSPGSNSFPGIALYQRVSQYGNNEASTSALLKSWNNIMRGEKDADSAAVAFMKKLAQNETPGSGLSVLDLTA